MNTQKRVSAFVADDEMNNKTDTREITIKLIEYGLAEGADEKGFLEASAKLMPELAKLRGFIRRELHKGEHSRWRDVVYWETREDADRSELDIPNIPACVTCIIMMDHSKMTVTHFELTQEGEK